jgi:hypothetical protein
MGLPLPDIVIYRYIRWEMSNNSTFFKTIEFKNRRLQLVIYSYLITKRKLNFANENIGILAMVINIKKALFRICCFKI